MMLYVHPYLPVLSIPQLFDTGTAICSFHKCKKCGDCRGGNSA